MTPTVGPVRRGKKGRTLHATLTGAPRYRDIVPDRVRVSLDAAGRPGRVAIIGTADDGFQSTWEWRTSQHNGRTVVHCPFPHDPPAWVLAVFDAVMDGAP